MRPAVLDPLFRRLSSLPGIGPRLVKPLTKLVGEHVIDLLLHLPTGLLDRRPVAGVADLVPGSLATLAVRIDRHEPPPRRGRPHRVICAAPGGRLDLVYFHARGDYIPKLAPVGEQRLVSGRVEMFRGIPQMVHPDHVVPPDRADEVPPLEPVYRLTAGIGNAVLGKAVRAALKAMPALPEWLDAPLVAREGWPGFAEALTILHHPSPGQGSALREKARRRLACDELVANQLALALIRHFQSRVGGRVLRGDGRLTAKARAALPFALTADQDEAIAEILADMASDRRMLRLLQGDVGSGKTVVALMAALASIEAGCQAALMAPTEILARQHHAALTGLARGLGLRIARLTGRDSGKARERTLHLLKEGNIDLLIGTHALFQESVEFADLGLAIIDEQHRFGVHQRLQLSSKGKGVDVLVMTATPIPRTLTLTAYGDMDVSRLREKPPGRQPVDTRVVSTDKEEQIIAGLARQMEAGARIYWVSPFVEDAADHDINAAEERFVELRARFGSRVVMAHGRQKPADRDAAMAAFASGAAQLLVATTVIEVGVDVPEASIMVIEGADRFGLAQLHQLRGRVGRGSAASTCILLYAPPLSETAAKRLNIMRETEDGFVIAEEDLRLRGAGEVLGTRQSGMPEFRVADMAMDQDLIPIGAADAKRIVAADPALQGDRGSALKYLLYLFERDAAVRFLRSG